MNVMHIILQIITAFLGALGFALLYQVSKEKLFWAALGGLLCWLMYLLCGIVSDSDVVRFFFASVVVTFYAEFMARRKKTPATVFLGPGTIPLIPGGSLYQTLAYCFSGAWEQAFLQGLQTILLAVAISCGILMTMTIMQVAGRKKEVDK